MDAVSPVAEHHAAAPDAEVGTDGFAAVTGVAASIALSVFVVEYRHTTLVIAESFADTAPLSVADVEATEVAVADVAVGSGVIVT